MEERSSGTYFRGVGGNGPHDPFHFRIQGSVIFIESGHDSGLLLASAPPSRFHVHTVDRGPNAKVDGFDVLIRHCPESQGTSRRARSSSAEPQGIGKAFQPTRLTAGSALCP